MASDIVINESSGDEDYSVRLPISRDDFVEFITNLLGRPQEIEQVYKGGFVLRREDVEHIHHLLIQRVGEQNHGSLVQFQAKFYYKKGRSVTIQSIEDFISFNEIKPLQTKRLMLTWVFLITFSGKTTPERQEVEITFREGAYPSNDVIIRTPFDVDVEQDSVVFLRIVHTARSWGQDIESLLSDSLKGFTNIDKVGYKLVKTTWTFAGVFISLFVAIAVIGLMTSLIIWLSRFGFEMNSMKYSDASSLIENFYNYNWLIPVIACNIVSIFIAIIMIASAFIWSEEGKFKNMSFILMNKEDEKLYRKYLSKMKTKNLFRISAIIGGLALGVSGNILSYYIIENLIAVSR